MQETNTRHETSADLPDDGCARNPEPRRDIGVSERLGSMLARKPRMLVTVALANKMARIVWALLINGEEYRAPGRAVA